MNAKKIFEMASAGLKREWPKIATGLGAGILIVGGYLVGKEVPKYKEELERRKEEKGEELTAKEKLPIAAKHFGPAIGAITGGIIMVGASMIENDKRINLATGAAALSEIASRNATKNLLEYKDAAKEFLSEEEQEKVQKKADQKAQERGIEEYRCSYEHCDFIPQGQTYCYDLLIPGKPFPTTYNTLRAIENEYTSLLLEKKDGASVTLSEIYEAMGREEAAKAADPLGWVYDDDPTHRVVKLHIDSAIIDGTPALTICPEAVLIDTNYYATPCRRYW